MATNPMSMMMGGGGMGGGMSSMRSPSSGSPSQSSDSSFSPSSLMGDDAEAGPDEQAKSDSTASLVQEVRGMEETLQSLASRYPDAAAEVRRAISSIRDVLKKAVNPGVEEPPAPSSMA